MGRAGVSPPYPAKGAIPFPGTIWRIGQAVKTPPFHGGNTGSIPVCVTIYAEVMEQADRADSKSVAARRVGSNPTFSTNIGV